MKTINERLYEIGIIPVIKIENAEQAVPLAKALSEGGLPGAEITFRSAAAKEAIRRIHEAMPDMLLGAGTVLTVSQVDDAVEAGASFIVSPGLNPKIVRYCQEKGVPVIPGCANPSDIEAALEMGLDTVKFFPAEAAGGLKMLKAMSAPYGNVKFMPTGGISPDNLLSYLQFNKIIACGGTFMVKEDYLARNDFDAVRVMTRKAVMTMLDFEFYHVAFNAENRQEAKAAADFLSAAFDIPMTEGEINFIGPDFEIMKNGGRGTKGHVGIKTAFLDRAMAYLSRIGVEFDTDTLTYTPEGKPKFVYIKGEILGFAFHLIQK
ncbi:MAG: bifunctional 4-hydroxy-2-oxoglutarate aldolase/2-dehydro-3-deoxy-phosphogluconate aldolase [Clostridia bacterium]|nr:bifunctional 4-hydroxy-2-oxoglutarate aldolase/2-dehydro-3-deoxy-phosphogluconate aldolase [Clostridia bacterium]